jgi:hypothetical protein
MDTLKRLTLKIAALKIEARTLIARQVIRKDLTGTKLADFSWDEQGPGEDTLLVYRGHPIGEVWLDKHEYNANFTLSNGKTLLELSAPTLSMLKSKFAKALGNGFTQYRGWLS